MEGGWEGQLTYCYKTWHYMECMQSFRGKSIRKEK